MRPRSGGSHFKIAYASQAEILTQATIESCICVEVRRFRRRGEDSLVSQPIYPVPIAPLSAEDGGEFLATVPDLPGCMSEGETPEDALRNVMDAIGDWIEASRAFGRRIPSPTPQPQIT
jgi:predicted RNase H-like HicB family nuclease